MRKDNQKDEKLSFEEALEKLRKLASELEKGDLNLEKALFGYEEAVKLASLCLEMLKEAEDRVKIITESLGGRLTLENFESSNND